MIQSYYPYIKMVVGGYNTVYDENGKRVLNYKLLKLC